MASPRLHRLFTLLVLWCAVARADESDPKQLVAQAEQLASSDARGALVLLEQALAQLDRPADAALRIVALRRRCWLTAYDDAATARTLADAGIAEAERASDAAAAADLHLCRGYAAEDAHDVVAAGADYELGVREGERLGDREVTANALLLRGQLRYTQGAFGEALEDLKRAYETHDALGHAADARSALNAIANVYADPRVAEYDRAIEYYAQVLAANTARNDARGVATGEFNIASTLQKKGDLAGALPHFERALATDRERGDADAVAYDQHYLGVLLGKLGRSAEALAALDAAAKYYAEAKDAEETAGIELSRGAVLRLLGRLPESRAELEAARAYFAAKPDLRFLAKVHDERAETAAAAQDWAEAYRARSDALAAERELEAKSRAEQTARLRVQFDSAKKEQENRVLGAENEQRGQALAAAARIRTLQWLLIGLAVAVALGLAFLIARLRTKNAELAAANANLAASREEVVRGSRKAELIFNALNDALSGAVLDEKYRIEQVIGSGGFGTVYRAIQVLLGTPVAVKVLKPQHGQDAKQALERFRLEGVSAFRVTHPNAVRVLDFGIAMDAVPYLAMELLDGRPLSDLIAGGTTFEPARVARILAPVCDALAQAHAAGIVHRDVKPTNILICNGPDGELVKLIDFGIAKVVGDSPDAGPKNLTGTGLLIGTPNYMAPERFLEMRPDGKVDVYSVGIVAYELLAGRRPFADSSENYMQVVMQHLHEPPPPLEQVAPQTPRELLDLVAACLAKTPRERPDAATLADGLRRFALGAA